MNEGTLVICTNFAILIMIRQNNAEKFLVFCVFIAKYICISQPNSLEYYNCAKARIKASNRYFFSHMVNVGSDLQKQRNVFCQNTECWLNNLAEICQTSFVELISPQWKELCESRSPLMLTTFMLMPLKPGNSNPQVNIWLTLQFLSNLHRVLVQVWPAAV